MKTVWKIFCIGFAIVACGFFAPGLSSAEANINVMLPLPGLVLPAPPGLIVVPGRYVYYPPDVEVDIFFYRGYWYRPYRGGWYIANGYNGPWRSIGPRRVPRPLYDMPPGFRRLPHRHERVPYRVVERNWRTWERDRHWDDDRHERNDRYRKGKHERREPGRGRERGRDKFRE